MTLPIPCTAGCRDGTTYPPVTRRDSSGCPADDGKPCEHCEGTGCEPCEVCGEPATVQPDPTDRVCYCGAECQAADAAPRPAAFSMPGFADELLARCGSLR